MALATLGMIIPRDRTLPAGRTSDRFRGSDLRDPVAPESYDPNHQSTIRSLHGTVYKPSSFDFQWQLTVSASLTAGANVSLRRESEDPDGLTFQP